MTDQPRPAPDPIRQLLDAYGDQAVALVERLRPLLASGKISEALIGAAEALRDAAQAKAPR